MCSRGGAALVVYRKAEKTVRITESRAACSEPRTRPARRPRDGARTGHPVLYTRDAREARARERPRVWLFGIACALRLYLARGDGALPHEEPGVARHAKGQPEISSTALSPASAGCRARDLDDETGDTPVRPLQSSAVRRRRKRAAHLFTGHRPLTSSGGQPRHRAPGARSHRAPGQRRDSCVS
jgi:hypothetical protein